MNVIGSGRGGAIVTLLCLAQGVTGCRMLGLPRQPVVSTSPNGELVAFVQNHASIDPLEQSLWPAERRGAPASYSRPNAEWCNQIFWSADGRLVGFLVQDAKLVVADAQRGTVVGEVARAVEGRSAALAHGDRCHAALITRTGDQFP